MSKFRSRKLTAALLSAFASLTAVSVPAQTTATSDTSTAAAAPDEPQRLDKFVVTGSYIPLSADAPAIPIRTVGAPEIEATGQTSDLLEVIRKSVPQFVGSGNLGSSNSNIAGNRTNGGSQIALRNVQTLVLINGRRAAFAPVAATGGFNFVDVNAIPVSAVERIEVLKDGASALYGSDAVSGVVNIILKKDYQGGEIGGRYGFSSENGYSFEDRSAHVTFGARSGKTSLTVSAEWVKTDPMFGIEREFSSDQTGKSGTFPGVVNYYGEDATTNYIVVPGKTPPGGAGLTPEQLVAQGYYTGPISGISRYINFAPLVTLSTGNEKEAVVVNLVHELGENLEVFGDMLYSHTDVFYQLAAQPIVGMPYAAQNTEFGDTLPSHPQSPFDRPVTVRNRFLDFPRKFYNDNNSIRGLLGLRGTFAEGWGFEVAGNLNRISQMATTQNVINRVALTQAIDSGKLNLFESDQTPEELRALGIFGTAFTDNRSTLNGIDGRINGEFLDLPAGRIQFAAGGEYRRETLAAEPDAGSYTIKDVNDPMNGQPALWDGATTTDPFSVSRTVASAFAEFRVPLISPNQNLRFTNTLELDVAGRYDRYSDTDDPVVPKVMLRWLPFNDEFAVRASYSESFAAASLYSLFGPTAVGYTSTPTGLEFLDGTVVGREADQAYQRDLPNPELKPEKAKTYNVGLIYSPRAIKGLTVETTYFQISKTDIVATPDVVLDVMQDVETLGPASKYHERVRLGGFNGSFVTAPGQISASYYAEGGSFTNVYVDNMSENFLKEVQDGVDFEVDYKFNWAPVGAIDLTFNALWYNRFELDGDDYVGMSNGRDTIDGGSIPEWRFSFRADVIRGNWLAGFYVQHLPSFEDPLAEPDEQDPAWDSYIEPWTSVDVYFGYNFRSGSGRARFLDGVSVRVGINNVFNEQPPQGRSSWEDANADTGTYDPIGRLYYVSANYKF